MVTRTSSAGQVQVQDELQVEHRGERMPGNSSGYELHKCSQDERFRKTVARYQFYMCTACGAKKYTMITTISRHLVQTRSKISTNFSHLSTIF